MTTDKEEARRRDALAARLAQLAQHWPQAEIARRTGASRNNVSRYLRGTRVPLDFGTALVEGLGINPGWLHSGEGAATLEGVSDATAQTAGDMLELVEAMSAVAQMRLGALAGRHHLRILRELNDALLRYEQLRERLNRQTAPVYRELLDHYERAVDDGDVDAAGSLQKALLQVRRLADDPELDARLLKLRAIHASEHGTPERGAKLMRQVFYGTLSQAGTVDEKALADASKTAQALLRIGRVREARAICGAALSIAHEMIVNGDAVWKLKCTRASTTFSLGDLAGALSEFSEGMAHMSEERRPRLYGKYVEMLVFGGFLDYQQAVKLWSGRFPMVMLWFALWTEERQVLEHACKNWIHASAYPPDSLFAGYACMLRDVLSGRKPNWLEFLDERMAPQMEKSEPGIEGPTLCVYSTQLARVAGDGKRGAAEFQQAVRKMKHLAPEFTPKLEVRATHHRNALEYGNKTQQQQARQFFQKHVQEGYRCFAQLA
jgi:transcriptional regulator with XRE-family HTH domain